MDAQDEDEDLKDDSEDSVADADLVNLVPLDSFADRKCTRSESMS